MITPKDNKVYKLKVGNGMTRVVEEDLTHDPLHI